MLLSLFLISISVFAGVSRDRAPGFQIPKNYLVFVADGPTLSPRSQVAAYAPLIVVFADRRIIWRVTSHRDTSGNDPRCWRTGMVDADKFRAFKQKLSNHPLTTANAGLKLKSQAASLDAPITRIGIRTSDKDTIVELSRRETGSGRFEKFAEQFWELKNAVLGLVPKKSEQYNPTRIQVGFFLSSFCGGKENMPIANWIESETEQLSPGVFRSYRGDRAEEVIRLLSITSRVRVGDRIMCAWWSPIID